jgi:PadR family transcriptional regulator PadR
MKKSIASGAKRGSVGILVLAALSTSDKYGWEIIKEIEDKSNGEYILKEPSLYSSLKRMETAGLITSYWKDSDIGGRRHYYNITEKGIQKLQNSDITWGDNKQFVKDLFSEEKNNKQSNTSLSQTQNSINEITDSVNKVKQTVKTLDNKDAQIKQVIDYTTKLESENVKEEKLKQEESGFVPPSVSPLQQDLFTSGIVNNKKEDNEEIQTEPKTNSINTTEQNSKALKNSKENYIQIDNKQEYDNNTNETNENAQTSKSVEVSKDTVTEETKELKKQENENIKADKLKPVIKKQKYSTKPSSTYVQMPMFEKEQTVNLDEVDVNKSHNEQTANKDKANVEDKEQKEHSSNINHLKNLATENDVLQMKNKVKRSNNSFLSNATNIDSTNLSGFNTTYNSFETKSSYEEKQTNNAFIKENKQTLTNNFEPNKNTVVNNKQSVNNNQDKDTTEQAEAKTNNANASLNQTSISNNQKTNTQKDDDQETTDKNVNTDNTDYKSILGDLFSDDEENSNSSEATHEHSQATTTPLPRLDVSKNVNVSLSARKKEQKARQNKEQENYTYSYNNFDDENKSKDKKQVNKTLKNEYEADDNKTIANTDSNSNNQLTNFNASLSDNEYSNSLLEETYLSNIKVRVHKTDNKPALLTTSYVSINKLNLNLSFALFMLMLIQIVGTYIGLSNASYINTRGNIIFSIATIVSFVPVLTFFLIYLFNPLRKKEITYNLGTKLANNFIFLLIALVFIYAINLFLGMNSLNTMDFISTWLLPAILSFNLLIIPVIKYILLKRKRYYL